MKKLLLFILIVFLFIDAHAQTPADSAVQHSPLKTVSDKQYNALMTGEDIYGMSLPAELNHYPYPGKALRYKKEINLTASQLTKITAIDKELTRKKLEMGGIIMRNERTLDSIFVYKRLDTGSLIFFANRYGLYQGELRNAILQACFATGNLLTSFQIKKLESLEKKEQGNP